MKIHKLKTNNLFFVDFFWKYWWQRIRTCCSRPPWQLSEMKYRLTDSQSSMPEIRINFLSYLSTYNKIDTICFFMWIMILHGFVGHAFFCLVVQAKTVISINVSLIFSPIYLITNCNSVSFCLHLISWCESCSNRVRIVCVCVLCTLFGLFLHGQTIIKPNVIPSYENILLRCVYVEMIFISIAFGSHSTVNKEGQWN